MEKRIIARTLIQIFFPMALLIVLLCGCSKQESLTYTGPPTKMTIGVAKGETATLLFGAERLGYFKQQGLDVVLKVFDSGVAAVEALHERRVDLAAPAGYVIVSNIGEHPHLRIVATINKIDTVEMIARKDRGIKSPADLKGKRIAVTQNSIAEFFLGKYLNANRMNMNDISMVNMTPAMMEKEISSDKIDAAIAWSPRAQAIKEVLGDKAISWPAQSESKYHLVLATRDDFINKEPAAMVRLIKALVMSEAAIAADPAAAQRDLAARFSIPEKYFATVWGQNEFKVSLDRSLLLELEEQSRFRQKTVGGTQSQPNYLQYLYLDALKAARPESVTIIH